MKKDFWDAGDFILDYPEEEAVKYYNNNAFTAMQALFLHNAGVAVDTDPEYKKQVSAFYQNLDKGLILTLNDDAMLEWIKAEK
jgi:hypothetical protein